MLSVVGEIESGFAGFFQALMVNAAMAKSARSVAEAQNAAARMHDSAVRMRGCAMQMLETNKQLRGTVKTLTEKLRVAVGEIEGLERDVNDLAQENARLKAQLKAMGGRP